MAARTDAPQQLGRASRKGKAAWRKHVDLAELEAGLETARSEILQGGIIVEKPSAELFFADPSGDRHIQHAYHKEHKPLRTDEILAQRSAVPAVDSRKRPASPAAARTTDGVLVESQRPAKRWAGISPQQRARLQGMAQRRGTQAAVLVDDAGAASEEPAPAPAPQHDPWAGDDAGTTTAAEAGAFFSFLDAAQPIRAPATLRRAPVSLAASGRVIAAVPKPLAESSYNPPSGAYFDAFMRAGQEEIEAEQRRRLAAEAEQELADRIEQATGEVLAQAAADEARMLERDAADEEEAEPEPEPEADPVTAAKRPARKTQAQRNKIQRRKAADRRAARLAQLALLNKQAGLAALIAAGLEAEATRKLAAAGPAAAARMSESQQDMIQFGLISNNDEQDPGLVLRKTPFGKVPPLPPSLDLILPAELDDSLRRLLPQGNPLRDRFRSLQLRARLEARRPVVQPRMPRVKWTEKWSYKDWAVPVRPRME
ncbi:MAG: hypothetical protein M1826_001612 [Phylliscum demangeonii]|nr:MAG: hypothetical protein M1826_001612 [Phylliscum demangeonii]